MKPAAKDSRLIADSLVDPAAFAGIFDRHAAVLLRYMMRRVGPSDAESLLGELFRVAFESRSRFDLSRSDARPWLYGIAANLVIKHHQTRAATITPWIASPRSSLTGHGPHSTTLSLMRMPTLNSSA